MAARRFALGLAICASLVPHPAESVAPAVLLMVKQIAQQAATSMLKDAVLSSLSGMGCKGIALSNALAAFDLRRGGSAMSLLPGMPMTAASIPPEMAARMGALMPGAGKLPAGLALDADQMAMLASLQQAMTQPLSPADTLATIDEMSELGFLPKAMQSELKECMALIPQAGPALGMGLGMLRPMLPQPRQAREDLHALSPEDQDEIAAALAAELRALPKDQRDAALEHVGSGFFPKRIGDAVKAQLAR
jgi:hypothetical protein